MIGCMSLICIGLLSVLKFRAIAMSEGHLPPAFAHRRRQHSQAGQSLVVQVMIGAFVACRVRHTPFVCHSCVIHRRAHTQPVLTFHSQDSCAALRMLREVVLALAWCSGTKGIGRAYDDERPCSQIFGHAAIVTCTALARRLSSIARCTVAYVGSGIRGPLTDGPVRFIFCGPRFASLEILAAHG